MRRLTPLECERLQGFPDRWTVPLKSDSRRYAAIGNAVTVPVAEWIGRRILLAEDACNHLGRAAGPEQTVDVVPVGP